MSQETAESSARNPGQGFVTYTLVVAIVGVVVVGLFFLGRWLLSTWVDPVVVSVPGEQGQVIDLAIDIQNLPQVRVIPSGNPPESVPVDSDEAFEVFQNNCAGETTASNLVERSWTVTYQAAIGEESLDDGRAILPLLGEEIQVGAAIAAFYEVPYGGQETITRTLEITATPGTNLVHRLQVVELWETGDLEWGIGEGKIVYPFRFRRDMGMEVVENLDLGCE